MLGPAAGRTKQRESRDNRIEHEEQRQLEGGGFTFTQAQSPGGALTFVKNAIERFPIKNIIRTTVASRTTRGGVRNAK